MVDAQGGNAQDGFELSVDRSKRVIRLRLWGLWDVPVAEQFRTALLKHGRLLQGASWGVLADSRAFMAQSSAVTEIRIAVMKEMSALGCARIGALVGEGVVYSMQFKRVAGESQMVSAVFRDEAKALAWVSSHQGDSPG